MTDRHVNVREVSLVEPGHTGTQLFQFCIAYQKSAIKSREGQSKDGGDDRRWKPGCLGTWRGRSDSAVIASQTAEAG